MSSEITIPPTDEAKRRFDWLHLLLIGLLIFVLTLVGTYWAIKFYLFPDRFRPVTLSAKEEQVLQQKLDRLESFGYATSAHRRNPPNKSHNVQPLEPEAYSEEGAKRQVYFKERELNALLAKNTDLAEKLAIDLSEDLVSAKLLLDLDEDFPVFGGKTLKVNAGVELAYQNDRPIVMLRGVSVMGVPVPNAWLGGIKNIDLVQEFGNEKGFWKSFADGIDYIKVEQGELKIKFKE